MTLISLCILIIEQYTYKYFDLLDLVGSIRIIPFPSLSVVIRKGLAPDGLFGVGLIPSKHNNNRSSYLIVFTKEKADPIIKRTYYGRVYGTAVAVHPVQSPKPGLGIESANRPAFVYFAIGELAPDNIEIAHSFEAAMIFHGAFEFGIFLAIGQSGIQVSVMHFPFSNKEIEIFVRRRGGGGYDQVSPVVKL